MDILDAVLDGLDRLLGPGGSPPPPPVAFNPKPGGYRSEDFPGVTPATRYGSFQMVPGFVMPWPEVAGLANDYFRPADAGFLRLPRLFVSTPNTFSEGPVSDMATPLIRKTTFPAGQ